MRPFRLLAAFVLLTLLVVAVLGPSGCANGNKAGFVETDASSSGGPMPDATSPDVAVEAAAPSGCQDNGDCASSTTGHVCVAGSCVVCGTSADCPSGQKCDNHTSCVACLTGADCSDGERCVNNACAMGCDATSTCPPGSVCNTMTNVCVGCLSNTDCTSEAGVVSVSDAGPDGGSVATPRCNTTTSTCVQCLASTDCLMGDVCQANVCVPGCSGSQKCPTGSVCDYADAGSSGTGACVGCMANSDCHVPTPWCDSMTNTCVPCTPSNPSCPTAQYCAGTSCVPGCNTNADCTADGGLLGGGLDASVEAGDAGNGGDAGDAGDGGAGGGSSAGNVCDTQNHMCVQCVTDNNCVLGETCQGNRCLPGCDATHGCPSGAGCCSGQCFALNTTSNCTACGVACDTTSGNSQGAACGANGCTYTGCAAGYADCNATAPDSDGCETNLGTANEKVCSADGKCVANGTCCSAADCTTPPTPTSCYPAQGTCVEGQACQYPVDSGSVVCGNTCCNPIEGTCSSTCALTCNSGYGHCVGDPSKGCETNTNTTVADCGDCARACSTSHTNVLSCGNGVCTSSCATGWGNCNEPVGSVADDGCESNLTTCVGTPCCGTLCTVPHSDGESQTYVDCADATGTPGTASTYNETMATLAAEAYPFANPSYFVVTCNYPAGQTETAIDICNAAGTACSASWCYSGACAGYVLVQTGASFCPAGKSGQTWD